jgi:hypothetical protein
MVFLYLEFELDKSIKKASNVFAKLVNDDYFFVNNKGKLFFKQYGPRIKDYYKYGYFWSVVRFKFYTPARYQISKSIENQSKIYF